MAKRDASFNFGANAPKRKSRTSKSTSSKSGRPHGAWAAYAKGGKR
jgi:hypothetical protein